MRREQGRFVVAAFSHSEARPEEHADGSVFPDVQRHHHLCFPNIIERSDGTWGAINSVGLRSARNALGAIFRLELASALQARGFAIQRADDGWSWTIAGVPAPLTGYFSARRKSLEDQLAAAGLTSAAAPALASAINSTERRAKVAMTEAELTQRWHDAARSLGYEPEAVIAAAVEAGRAAQAEQAAVFDRGAVRAELTEHDATFARCDLIEAVANGLVGTGATAMTAIQTADALVADGDVVVLAEARDGPVYSTPRMVAIERELVELVQRGANTHVAHPDKATVETLIASARLNAEQGQVVRAATAGKRLVLVQGGAGTGKSTALGAVAAAWQSAGYKVLGASVAWRAANALGEELGIESRAIDAWLSSIDHGNAPFPAKTCLLIEESGLQSSPQALRLLQAIDRAGGNSVAVMIGDEDQLRPVGPGHAMRLIREAVGATSIRTVVRQREAWARKAPRAFARGKARQALDAFADRGLVHFHENPRATVEALADRRQQLVDTAPGESVVVVARTNAEGRALSAAIRNRLRERGAIVGEDIAVEAADASGNRYMLRLAMGDKVRFLRRNDALGVVNGTEACIVAMHATADGRRRFVAEESGRRFDFSLADIADAKGRARLAHSYSATIFQAQGMTVDRALVLLSANFDRHDAYVASSRARERTEFFIDTKALERELDQVQQPEPGEATTEARMAFLARRLSRASLKTNALDYAQNGRARARRKELEHELQA